MTDFAQTGYLEVPGGQIYYEAEGTGPALTLIHAGVAHLRMWDDQVAAWRDGFRVIRYDTRGFGRTQTEDVPYSNREDLRAMLDHFDVERTHIVGLSRGAMIALDFTVENPGRVSSLVWVAGGLRGFETEEDPRLVDVEPELQRLEDARDWEALVELETRIWTDGPGQRPDRVDPDLRRRMIEWNLENYRAEQEANQAIQPEVPAAQLLDRLTMPCLFMWGTLDESSVLEAGEKLVAEVPGARSHVFEGVAHMVNLERPEVFNRIVRDFLEEVDSGDQSG